MQHIVLFSGGIQSSYVAEIICRQERNVTLLFHDTRTEPADNYRFREDVSNHVGVAITEQSDGRNIWELFDDEHFLGNNRVPLCSRVLKAEQGALFYSSLDGDFTIYFGFGPKEWGRAQKVVARNPKLNINFPLIEERIHSDTIRSIIVNNWGICLPQMYQHFNHANCIPCVRWKKYSWAQCYKHYPDAYQRAIQKEDKSGHTIMPGLSLRDFEHDIFDNQLFIEDTLPCICAV